PAGGGRGAGRPPRRDDRRDRMGERISLGRLYRALSVDDSRLRVFDCAARTGWRGRGETGGRLGRVLPRRRRAHALLQRRRGGAGGRNRPTRRRTREESRRSIVKGCVAVERPAKLMSIPPAEGSVGTTSAVSAADHGHPAVTGTAHIKITVAHDTVRSDGVPTHRLGHRVGAHDGIFAEWEWNGARLVARTDRYGFSPIYYYATDSTIAVSSSIAQLLEL